MSNATAEVPLTSTMQGYYHWVDIAKGLGVILVLLGHMLYITTFDTLNQVIYSFHVPMYFALSGMLLKSSSKGFWQYTWEKALRILIPAYALQILLTGLRVVIWRDVAFDTEFWLKLAYWDGAPKWNEPTWFFICMFGVCLLQKIIHLPEMSMDWRIAVMLMSIVLGYVFVTYELHYFGAANFLICFSSFILGSVLMHIIQTYPRQYFKWILLGALLVWGSLRSGIPKSAFFIMCMPITGCSSLPLSPVRLPRFCFPILLRRPGFAHFCPITPFLSCCRIISLCGYIKASFCVVIWKKQRMPIAGAL